MIRQQKPFTARDIKEYIRKEIHERAIKEKESSVHEIARRLKSYIQNVFSDEKDRERMFNIAEEYLRQR